MKNPNIILHFLCFIFFLLLSACNGDEDTNSNGTPSLQSSNANQTSSPKSPPSEIKTMRINQDLTLRENTEDSIDSYFIYYENSKCALDNIGGKGKLKADPLAKKQLKKNETYKAFGFRLTYSNRAPYV